MAGYVIKYSKSVYVAKINSLDSCVSELTRHLDVLENLRNQVKSFWDDDNARKLLTQIAGQITRVRAAMDDCNNLKRLYQENVDKMAGSTEVIDDIQNDIDRSIENSSKIVGSAADILDLIL